MGVNLINSHWELGLNIQILDGYKHKTTAMQLNPGQQALS